MTDAALLSRKLARETAAREEAERLLETKSAELFEAKQREIKARAQLLNAINSVQEGFVLIGEDGHIALLNASICGMFGIEPDFFGQSATAHDLFERLSGFLFSDKPEAAQAWLASEIGKIESAAAGQADREPEEVTGPDSRTFLFRHRPMLDGGIVTTITETTARTMMETQLRQSQRLEALGNLAGGVAHEINTPVQYVSDNIEFLGDAFSMFTDLAARSEAIFESGSNPEILKDLHRMLKEDDLGFYRDEVPAALAQSRDGIRQIAKIVRAVKEFSHPGTSERTSVDLNHLIQNASTVTHNRWKYVATFDIDLPDESLEVQGYPDELSQVLYNLIMNAVDAVFERHGESGEGALRVAAKMSGGAVEIRVTDNGPGMDEATRNRIFDMFFTTKPPGKGTGQGLTICHRIIADKHGGEIFCQSEPGQGTTFTIRLPIGTADADEAGAQAG